MGEVMQTIAMFVFVTILLTALVPLGATLFAYYDDDFRTDSLWKVVATLEDRLAQGRTISERDWRRANTIKSELVHAQRKAHRSAQIDGIWFGITRDIGDEVKLGYYALDVWSGAEVSAIVARRAQIAMSAHAFIDARVGQAKAESDLIQNANKWVRTQSVRMVWHAGRELTKPTMVNMFGKLTNTAGVGAVVGTILSFFATVLVAGSIGTRLDLWDVMTQGFGYGGLVGVAVGGIAFNREPFRILFAHSVADDRDAGPNPSWRRRFGARLVTALPTAALVTAYLSLFWWYFGGPLWMLENITLPLTQRIWGFAEPSVPSNPLVGLAVVLAFMLFLSYRGLIDGSYLVRAPLAGYEKVKALSLLLAALSILAISVFGLATTVMVGGGSGLGAEVALAGFGVMFALLLVSAGGYGASRLMKWRVDLELRRTYERFGRTPRRYMAVSVAMIGWLIIGSIAGAFIDGGADTLTANEAGPMPSAGLVVMFLIFGIGVAHALLLRRRKTNERRRWESQARVHDGNS